MRFFVTAIAFALCGAAARATFQYVETRWQVVIFVTMAAVMEISADDRGRRASKLRFAVNASSAAAAIIAVKWYIEGVSPLVLTLLP